MFDGKAFGAEIVGVVKAHVERSIAPLLTQLEALRSEIAALKSTQIDADDLDSRLKNFSALLKDEREAARIEAKEKRKSAVADLKAGILADCETIVSVKIAELPAPKEIDPNTVADMVAAGFDMDLAKVRIEIAEVKDAIPQPVILPDIPALIAEAMAALPEVDLKAMVDEAVAAIPAAEKGKDADPELVASLVKETVERAVAAIPVPKNGDAGADGVTLEELLPVIGQEVAKAVSAIRVPKDGLDAVEFFRAENGHLIVTMSNGTTRDLGQYIGKDGVDGKNGADAILDTPDVDLAAVTKMIEDAVAKHTVEPPLEFAPDEVAANVSLTVKMMAEAPQTVPTQQRSDSQPINVSVTMPEMKASDTTVNVSLPEQLPPSVTVEPSVVNVMPANVHVETRRGKEVTKVTGWDKNGRITSFEKTETD